MERLYEVNVLPERMRKNYDKGDIRLKEILWDQDKDYFVVVKIIDRLTDRNDRSSCALLKRKEGECYIVYQAKDRDKLNTSTYYLKDGAKREILLIGNDPHNELSDVFKTSKRNCFLVKGYINKELSDHVGCDVFYVESGDIIKPIIREYGPEDYRPEQRFFSPSGYLDEYDIRSKDFIPLIHYDLFMFGIECDYYLSQKGYHKITPCWNGDSLDWFIEEEGNEFKVTLEGSSPEYVFNNNILYNERDEETGNIRGNYFIANGLLKNNKEGREYWNYINGG